MQTAFCVWIQMKLQYEDTFFYCIVLEVQNLAHAAVARFTSLVVQPRVENLTNVY